MAKRYRAVAVGFLIVAASLSILLRNRAGNYHGRLPTGLAKGMGESSPRLSPVRIEPRWKVREEGPEVARTLELITFPNPAASNIVTVVEHYASPGWMKTGILEDATMFCCLMTQVMQWQRDEESNRSKFIKVLENDPSIPREIVTKESALVRSPKWNTLKEFYYNTFSNRFATYYGIEGGEFVNELSAIPYNSPIPVFK